MRESTANLVHSIIKHGLTLRDRLEAGEPLDPAAEHAVLVDMLAPLALEEIWEAEEAEAFGIDLSAAHTPEVRDRLSQATIRYALVAWLDSFLLRHSLWGSTWNDHALGAALYKDRTGRKFWEEARYAETRKDLDALEVLYWCVMLGFRGEGRGLSEPIGVWAARIRSVLDDVPERAAPVAAPPEVLAPTLTSDLPYRRMMFAGLTTAALAVPLAFWLVWRHWTLPV